MSFDKCIHLCNHFPEQDMQYLYHNGKLHGVLFRLFLLNYIPCKVTTALISKVSFICSELHINRSILYVLFGVRLFAQQVFNIHA